MTRLLAAMSEGEGFKIALATLGAVAVFVVGQIIQRVFLEPLQEQRRVVGKIAYTLTFYANMGGSTAHYNMALMTPAKPDEAMKHLRGLAAELLATRHSIPMYRVLSALRIVVEYSTVKKASTQLIGWSNSFGGSGGSADHRTEIGKLLRIDLL